MRGQPFDELVRCGLAVKTRIHIAADLFRWVLTLISDLGQDAMDNARQLLLLSFDGCNIF